MQVQQPGLQVAQQLTTSTVLPPHTTRSTCIECVLSCHTESLTVLKGVGVVLTTNRRCLSSSSTFLDMQDIHSVIINEVRVLWQLQYDHIDLSKPNQWYTKSLVPVER